mmetsp:Transcript_10632/g.15648  ORF Transcript_10632/g.15648 Transcript_10632/m.15648 type:complete len:480 (-) Transcript_10632:22-1461(-)
MGKRKGRSKASGKKSGGSQEKKKNLQVSKALSNGVESAKPFTLISVKNILSATLVAIISIFIGLCFQKNISNQYVEKRTESRSAVPEFEALVEWVQQNGGKIDDRIVMRDGPFGRGLFYDGNAIINASDKIDLFAIPEHLFLSVESIKKRRSVMAPLLADAQLNGLWDHHTILLSVAILAEQNAPNSFWGAYIDSIPKYHDGQPLFWSDEDLEHLQSPVVARQIITSRNFLNGFRKNLLEMIDRHPEIFPASQKATIVDDFIWAYYTVTSRAFDVGVPGSGNDVLGMIPFTDLMNHEYGSNSVEHYGYVVMPERKLFYAGAVTEMETGNELTTKYKRDVHSMKYFYVYGMLDGNLKRTQGDYILLRDASNECWPVNTKGRVDPELFDLFNLEDLSSEVQNAIDSFPSTLGQDEEELKKYNKVSSNTPWIALILRIRFKRIFHNFLNSLNENDGDGIEEGNFFKKNEKTTAMAMYILDIS